MRLGTWLPFRPAAVLLAEFTGTTVDEATVRRRTEAAGAAYVAAQTAEVTALEATAPAPPQGPLRQLLSVDGAMVPLVGGTWAEVKTLALGVVQPPVQERGVAVIHTTDLSYFSRRAEATEFTRLALAETHRRGVATAGRVAGVVDGAEWAQGFLDYHRPDAVRILDFPHAAEYVARIGQVAGVADAAGTWLAAQLHELRHGTPTTVLADLRAVQDDLAARVTAATASVAALETATTSLGYLEHRRAQLTYAAFTAAGYPSGSGSVESANKLVVEVRLKGAGMHWAPAHVNPMVALRTVVCNDRWAEAWSLLAAELRGAARHRSQQRRQQHLARPVPPPVSHTPPPPPARPAPPALSPPPSRPARRATSRTAAATVPHRPAANHPWRCYGRRLNPRVA